MKSSPSPDLEIGQSDDELDAGWGELDPKSAKPPAVAQTAKSSMPAPAAVRSAPASLPAPVDELDDGWGDEDEDDDDEDDDDDHDSRPEPGVVAARSAAVHSKPLAAMLGSARRTLSKKERRAPSASRAGVKRGAKKRAALPPSSRSSACKRWPPRRSSARQSRSAQRNVERRAKRRRARAAHGVEPSAEAQRGEGGKAR